MGKYDLETTLVVTLNRQLSSDYLNRVGREIVRTIEKRTLSGKDKSGNSFYPYSKEYKESMEFRIAGKSPNNVNLKLTGEMLGDLSVIAIDEKKGQIIIGFEDEQQKAKAHGHITGAEGNLPVRDFLGISKSELEDIVSSLPKPEQAKKAKIATEDIRRIMQSEAPASKGTGVSIVDLLAEYGYLTDGADIL